MNREPKTLSGLAGWLLARLRREDSARPRLAILERVTLAPRHSLALIEAEGKRVLVATSPDGAPAFYSLDCDTRVARPSRSARIVRRASW